MKEPKKPLSNAQLELLKIFSFEMTENELRELKSHLVDFFAKKAMDSADKAWKEDDLSNDIMDEWLNE